MFVYVIRSRKKKRGPIKIGKTKDPVARLKCLQTGNHEKLSIIHLVKCKSDMNANSIEYEFHRKLKKLKIKGEWFKAAAIIEFRKAMSEMRVYSKKHYPPALGECWTL